MGDDPIRILVPVLLGVYVIVSLWHALTKVDGASYIERAVASLVLLAPTFLCIIVAVVVVVSLRTADGEFTVLGAFAAFVAMFVVLVAGYGGLYLLSNHSAALRRVRQIADEMRASNLRKFG